MSDHRVDGKGEQLSRDDHQLVLGHQPAAERGRGELREIGRHHDRGATDREPEQEAERRERRAVGREGAGDRTRHEYAGKQPEGVPAADPVREPPGEKRSERRAQQQRRGNQPLVGRCQPEVAAHVEEGAIHDAGVIAEEQAAGGRDQADEEQPPPQLTADRCRNRRRAALQLEVTAEHGFTSLQPMV